MKKALVELNIQNLFHFKEGIRLEGPNEKMFGNCTGLFGNCSDLYGNCSRLYGDCSDLRGDCSRLRGDLDECGLTAEDRANGVNVADLVG